MMGICEFYLGDLSGALAQSVRARDAARRIGHRVAEVMADEVAGFALVGAGHDAEAVEPIMRSLPLARAIGSRRFAAIDLVMLSHIARRAGDPNGARRHLDESADLLEPIGPKFAGPMLLSARARVAASREECARLMADRRGAAGRRCALAQPLLVPQRRDRRRARGGRRLRRAPARGRARTLREHRADALERLHGRPRAGARRRDRRARRRCGDSRTAGARGRPGPARGAARARRRPRRKVGSDSTCFSSCSRKLGTRKLGSDPNFWGLTPISTRKSRVRPYFPHQAWKWCTGPWPLPTSSRSALAIALVR